MRQVGRFGVVGLANTLLDFVLFQLLTKLFGIPIGHVWIAKAISGTVALAVSFYLNRSWVFRAGGGWRPETAQAVRFVVATAIGVYAIQTPLTQLFATWLSDTWGEAFVTKTVAFGLATLVSLSWNFEAYRWWVFRGRSSERAGVR